MCLIRSTAHRSLTSKSVARFDVRVSVDELGTRDPQGVAVAFLDLLYTDELVATPQHKLLSDTFPFDITFGALFQGGLESGSAATPGILDEVGGIQPSSARKPITIGSCRVVHCKTASGFSRVSPCSRLTLLTIVWSLKRHSSTLTRVARHSRQPTSFGLGRN